MSSKADLKVAMESLQVRTPLRLQSRTPMFQAPKAVEEARTAQETQEEPAAPVPTSGQQSPNPEQSGSSSNPVQAEPGLKQTGSNLSPVPSVGNNVRNTAPFTAVPHDLLRGQGKFSDPLDFMVYLHLYTFSWGFSRETASMSQGQLEVFTGAARNTVRRALERLTQQGWIKMVEDYIQDPSWRSVQGDWIHAWRPIITLIKKSIPNGRSRSRLRAL